MTTNYADLPRRHEENVPWEQLTPHPDNPRRGDLEVITESIIENGWYGTIVVQESTKHILIGNHRARAAKENLAMKVCPEVQWLDCDDETALRIMLNDNRSSDLAYYDDQTLAGVLKRLQDSDDGLAGTGFDTTALDLVMQNLKADEEGRGSHGEVADAPTPKDRTENWGMADIRSVILPYGGEDYDRVVDTLLALRSQWSMETNAQVVLQLLLDVEIT